MLLAFLLAVIFVVLNGIPQLYLAKSLGFKLKPSAFAFWIGAIGNAFTGNIAPISAQAETISLAGLVKNPNQRLAALLFAALFGIILGITGGAQWIVNFAGPASVTGMMAGVGLILALVVVNFVKTEKRTAVISLISGIITYIICLNAKTGNELIYTIAVSMIVSILDYTVLQKKRVSFASFPPESQENDNWKFWTKEYWSDFKILKPSITTGAILSGLGIICLNIGANISFGTITNSIAGTELRINALTVINSLADVPSVLFGGTVAETIISGTAAAPHPLLAGIVMMIVLGALCFTGVLGRLGKYIPAESIAGFLAIIAVKLTLVSNLAALGSIPNAEIGVVSFAITALTKNPFIGLVAGIIALYTKGLFGLLF
jgi:AGZA family xanthine/uracil permease-like MFS transporter